MQALRCYARLLVRPVHRPVCEADHTEGARDQSRLLCQSQGHRALRRQVPQGERYTLRYIALFLPFHLSLPSTRLFRITSAKGVV